MTIRRIGKSLIALGVLLILFSLFMPVSEPDSQIVNLHLMNQKQNTLIIGGLLFVSGIVLFATFKIKQTDQEARLEAEAMEALKQKTSDRIAEEIAKNRSTAKRFYERIWGKRGEPAVAKKDHPIARIITGIFVGVIITALILAALPESMTLFGLIGFPIAIWLAFRPISASVILSRIYVASTVVLLSIPIAYLIDYFLHPGRRHTFEEGVVSIIPAAISCAVAIYARKKMRPKP